MRLWWCCFSIGSVGPDSKDNCGGMLLLWVARYTDNDKDGGDGEDKGHCPPDATVVGCKQGYFKVVKLLLDKYEENATVLYEGDISRC
jgi:hypothetical protein